jgi:hypothetical protein
VRLFPKLSSAVIATVVVGSALAIAPATEAVAAEPTTSWSLGIGTWSQTSSPTIADVNGDGQNDVTFGADDGRVRVLNGNGGNVPGWPQNAGTAIDSSISVADLDGDGANEVIVPSSSRWGRSAFAISTAACGCTTETAVSAALSTPATRSINGPAARPTVSVTR